MFSRVLFSSKGQCYRTLIRPHKEEKEPLHPSPVCLQSWAVGASVHVHGPAVEPPSLTCIPPTRGKAQAWRPCTGAAKPLVGWKSQPSASVPGESTTETQTSCLGCPGWPVISSDSSSELPAKYRGKPALPEHQHTPSWICHGKNLEGILEDHHLSQARHLDDSQQLCP